MKRTHLNFLIDGLALVAMTLLLSTGLILAHKLPHGSGGEHGVGMGQGATERAVTMLWGWTRHQWGDLHYWIAYALLAILAVHLALHWKWILCVVQGKSSRYCPYRLMLGGIALAGVIALSASPLVSPTTVVKRGELAQKAAPDSQLEFSISPANAALKLRGSMSLEEVANASAMTVNELLVRLELPASVPASERVGRLLRQHGLDMEDLRAALGRMEPGN